MATIGPSSGLSFGGLASGIDTSKLVEGLTKFTQKRIDTLTARKTEIATKQTKFAELQGKLFNLQFSTNALARSAGSAFDGRKAVASDSTALGVTAGTAAVPGTYTINVDALAKAAQVTSEGFADPNATIKEGTLTLQVGAGDAKTITIDSRNNTLQGFADAVNAAGGDVRASVVNDGSATPYRVLLTSGKTGVANEIKITGALSGGTGATFTPDKTVVQAAADAKVTIGRNADGSGGLAVTSATNQVNNLVGGVSLNLLRAEANKPITVTVTNDTESTVKAVQSFVESYNDVRDFITEQTAYDSDSKSAGVLLGNRDAAVLGDELSAALAATVPGLNANANRLSSVGLAITEKGKLTFDSAKLSTALSGQAGVSPADVKKLFAVSGSSDNPGVEFVLGGPKTKPSGTTPYQVQVTIPATRAVVVSSGPPAPSVIISPPNNTLQIKVNGLLAAGITLDQGTYTPDTLVSLLQKQINAAPQLDGNPVAVSLDSGKIQITSQQYGAASSVELVDGTALAQLGFTAGQKGTGTNVAGSFVVNGVTETATGSGQVLSGENGNANTAGLQVRSSLSSAGTANVTVGQGLAGRLNAVLNKYLDGTNGRFKAINDTFKEQVADVDKTITRQNDIMATKTAELESRFAAMETAINSLKGLQTQLSTFTIPSNK